MQAGLKEIGSELGLFDQDDQLAIELRVWVDNFLYFLNLETPEKALETYIPLLQSILIERHPEMSHSVVRKIDTLLKNPAIHSVYNPLFGERSLERLLGGRTVTVQASYHQTPRLVSNYSPLEPLRSDNMLLGTYEGGFLRFWKLRERLCTQVGRVDSIHNKMGKTSRVIQEHIFTFLTPSELRKTLLVCKDFFRRCNSMTVFKAVHIPELMKNFPEMFKGSKQSDFQTLEQIRGLVDAAEKSKEVLDSSSNLRAHVFTVAPFQRDLRSLRVHLHRALVLFPTALELFRATGHNPLNPGDKQ